MKPLNILATKLNCLINRRTLRNSLLILLPAMVAASFIASSSARRSETSLSGPGSAKAQLAFLDRRGEIKFGNSAPLNIFRPGSGLTPWSFMLPQQPPSPEAIDTYTTDNQGNCTNTLQDQFTIGDNVCAKVANISSQPRSIYWVNQDDNVVQTDTVNSGTPSATRVVSQVGKWRAYLVDTTDGSSRAVAAFSVSDPQNPAADLSVVKGADSSTYTAGGFIRYTITVANNGPDTADMVALTESTPNNTTLTSPNGIVQTSGPVFTCTPGSPTVCTTNGLGAGVSASFTFVYQVDAATPVGTVIENTASVTSQTTELNSADNTTKIDGTVIAVSTNTGTCSVACPDDITTPANTVDQNNNPGAIVHFSPPTGNDECGAIVVDHCDDCFFPQGTTTVTATAATGQSCSFTVTVTAPNPSQVFITCPANKDVGTTSSDSQCQTNVDVGTPTTTGGQNVTISSSRSDGMPLTDPYPVGTTVITWTATSHDGQGNDTGNASCQQTVTVHDKTAPVITCPANVTTGTDPGSCSATVNPGTATATDNCDSSPTVSAVRSDNQPLSAPYPKGTTTITWTAIDSSGNLSSCTQTVTVNDTEKPVITCPANVTQSNDPGSCSANVNPGTATATDNCDTPTVTGTRSDNQSLSSPYPVGTTTITWTATDSSGNSSSCTQTVTVNDTENPTITAPPNVTANTGPGRTTCDAVVSDATLGTASAHDNCPGVTVSRSPSGNTFPVGTTTVTWTATDAHGNTATATQTVTVNDNTPPVVTPPANVTAYTGPGATSCGTFVSDATLGTASATDNCPGVSGVTRTGVPSGNFFPVGTTTITYSATDAHGNSSSATQTVTVIDNTPPVISCPANITLEPTCPSGAIANYTTPVGTDNCPGVTTTRTAGGASGSVFPIGTTTVTYTATDAAGNSTSCSFTVTVKTVTQTIEDLKTSINNSSLSPANKGGLIAKLQAAEDALAIGHTSTACTKLADFINSTQNLINHGDISAETGNAWISTATHLRNAIGCTNDPCS
jgi:uncharacterized repeat protein (TIGR01451 family)